MKRILLYTLATLLLTACGKTPVNGLLDGQWHLTDQYHRTVPGTPYTQHLDKRSDRVYWAFQLQLLSLRYKPEGAGSLIEFMARFSHEGDRLAVGPVYQHGRDNDDLLTDTATTLLEPVGISGCTARFTVNRLSGSSMVLTNATDSLIFKKCN